MVKKNLHFLFLLLMLLFFLGRLSFWYTLRSYFFMPIYDHGIVKDSSLLQKGIRFHIPNGRQTREKDWYPYMLHHNGSEAFSQYIGKNVSLDILYSFGHFDFWKGRSSFYDLSSPYCGAFYGGYTVFTEDPQWMYGFHQDGTLSLEELSKVPNFDQTHLVLPSVGLPADQSVFHYQVKNIKHQSSYIGYRDWIKIDADIQTNAPIHQRSSMNYPGYYQYGLPPSDRFPGQNYPLINLKGRTYIRYFKEYGGTFFLYILAKDTETLDKCDQQLLSAASITTQKNKR